MIKAIKDNWINLPGILITFFLPFSMAIPNIMIPFGLATIIYKMKRKESIIFKPLFPFVYFFLALIILFLYKRFFIEDIKLILRISIVFISALILLNTSRKQVVNAFILSIGLAIIYSILKILFTLYVNKSLDLSNGETIYSVLPIDRPYFGFLILINSLLLFEKIKKKEINKNFATSLILINITFVFFIAARLTILTYMIIILLYFFKHLKIKFLYKTLFLSMFMLIGIGVLSVNKNFTDRLKLDKGFETFIDYEPRFVIWPCTIKILQEDYTDLISGPVGYKSGTKALKNCYSISIQKQDKREWYLEKGFNAHNQFLGILMIMGFLGLIMFLNFILQLFKSAKNSFIYLSIVFALLLFFLFECILYRQIGCYIVGIIISLVNKKNG